MKDGFHLSAGRPNKPSMMTRKMGSRRRELERNEEEEEEGDAALDRRRDPFRRWNAGGPGDTKTSQKHKNLSKGSSERG